jgi:hypothetical protein
MTIYLYAIARAGCPDIDLAAGIAGQPVYRVTSGPLCAFVSDYDGTMIRAERRHIVASQAVLRALQAGADFLPMVFGVLTPSAEAVGELLGKHCNSLLAQLDQVGGSVEMGVRLNLDVPDPIAYVVKQSAELRRARDRAFGRHQQPSHGERIRLGQLCETALKTFREAQAARLVAQLSGSCTAISLLPIQEDRQVANLAVLVPRAGVAALEAAVLAAAETFDDDMAFNLNGPWPPHNFVQLNLES